MDHLRGIFKQPEMEFDLGIVGSYPYEIPKKVGCLFKEGMLGIQPSLLPMYEGPSAIEQSILNEEKSTGVSIFNAVEEPRMVYRQQEHDMTPHDTYMSLSYTLGELGGAAIMDALEDLNWFKNRSPIQSGDMMSDTLSSTAPYIPPHERVMLWDRLTAREASRHFLALHGSPHAPFAMVKADNTWKRAYFQEVSAVEGEEEHMRALSGVKGDADAVPPGAMFWKYYGKRESEEEKEGFGVVKPKLYIKCREGWLCTPGVGVEGGRYVNASRFISKYLGGQHPNRVGEFRHRMAVEEDVSKTYTVIEV